MSQRGPHSHTWRPSHCSCISPCSFFVSTSKDRSRTPASWLQSMDSTDWTSVWASSWSCCSELIVHIGWVESSRIQSYSIDIDTGIDTVSIPAGTESGATDARIPLALRRRHLHKYALGCGCGVAGRRISSSSRAGACQAGCDGEWARGVRRANEEVKGTQRDGGRGDW